MKNKNKIVFEKFFNNIKIIRQISSCNWYLNKLLTTSQFKNACYKKLPENPHANATFLHPGTRSMMLTSSGDF